eukprot:8720877-Alexandrium_andersonii.AAC.1
MVGPGEGTDDDEPADGAAVPPPPQPYQDPRGDPWWSQFTSDPWAPGAGVTLGHNDDPRWLSDHNGQRQAREARRRERSSAWTRTESASSW